MEYSNTAIQLKRELNMDCTLEEYEEYKQLKAQSKKANNYRKFSKIYAEERIDHKGVNRRMMVMRATERKRKEAENSMTKARKKPVRINIKTIVSDIASNMVASNGWNKVLEVVQNIGIYNNALARCKTHIIAEFTANGKSMTETQRNSIDGLFQAAVIEAIKAENLPIEEYSYN